jgi:hypothetical protein
MGVLSSVLYAFFSSSSSAFFGISSLQLCGVQPADSPSSRRCTPATEYCAFFFRREVRGAGRAARMGRGGGAAAAFFFPRSLYTLGKAYACKARSECDSVWASAPGIGQPGSASKPLWHREETLKTIHGYAT